ncbi:UNVERIFIED_CONTAM: hypothetical protein Scaly_0591000 [Sesamum calycinum]|uniref:Uncharacterized protein n=1 Tax=Sesamum calycinum TaxID=2727403 RepID=A0AAW2RS82_9LAMI
MVSDDQSSWWPVAESWHRVRRRVEKTEREVEEEKRRKRDVEGRGEEGKGHRHPYTIASIAKIFFDDIYKLHGLPVSIVNDKDNVFTSKFWNQLFSLSGVSLDMSLAYNHQSDGQTERLGGPDWKMRGRGFLNYTSKGFFGWRVARVLGGYGEGLGEEDGALAGSVMEVDKLLG